MSVKRTRTDGTRSSVIAAVVEMLAVRQDALNTYDATMKDLAALPEDSKLRSICTRDLAAQSERIEAAVSTLHGLHEKLLGDGETFVSKMLEYVRSSIGEVSKETQTKFYANFPEQQMEVKVVAKK